LADQGHFSHEVANGLTKVERNQAAAKVRKGMRKEQLR
jgi:hypothetical protein